MILIVMQAPTQQINISFISEDKEQILFELPRQTSVGQLKSIIFSQNYFEIDNPEKIVLTVQDPVSKCEKFLIQDDQKIGDISHHQNNLKIKVQESNLRGFSAVNMQHQVKVGTHKSRNPKSVRRVKEGLIIKSRCNNQKCEAFGKETNINKGIGFFNIGKQILRCPCPLCEKNGSKATNFGYYKCKIHIEGQKQDGEKFEKEFIADDSCYHTFRDNPQDFTIWTYIEAVTSIL